MESRSSKNHVAWALDLFSTSMVQFFDKERFASFLDTEAIALRGSGYVERLFWVQCPAQRVAHKCQHGSKTIVGLLNCSLDKGRFF